MSRKAPDNPQPQDPGGGPLAIDRHFGRFIAALGGGRSAAQAAALLSRAVRSGDICLDLAAAAADDTPPPEQWAAELRGCPAVGAPGELKPLILDAAGRLYLYRYWRYERRLADAIRSRVAAPAEGIAPSALAKASNAYFPPPPDGDERQRTAAAVALSRRLCVITGGPGTGKSYTVARIMALFCEVHRRRRPVVRLAAPTGKAAAQLKAAIGAARRRLRLPPEVDALVPEDVSTIHRLLRPVPGTAGFYHHAANPLAADLVVVDEASMVDLALMAKLADAVPPSAGLVLVGDRDQLASVEAGSVLGDICGPVSPSPGVASPAGGSSGGRSRGTGLAECIVVLERNYRFAAQSGIGGLSRAVTAGDADRALALLRDPPDDSLHWVDYSRVTDAGERLARELAAGYGNYLRADDPRSALAALQGFQVLCALRQGPHGADGLNRLAASVFKEHGLLRPVRQAGGGYHGRPVIITRNHYELGLFNGDIGVQWDTGGSGDRGAVWFPDGDGAVRAIWPHLLPEHETVFAMTVHKSQGSEFDSVLLVLPPRDHPLLTRELIYTALTRARRRLTVWAPEAVLRAAVARRVERRSGLREALWPDSGQDR